MPEHLTPKDTAWRPRTASDGVPPESNGPELRHAHPGWSADRVRWIGDKGER
uniref:Uncharacterized protein n=1 Tax=Streptoalloteichus sp. ATCC 53650 TaxID=756733 RepID=K4NYN5_9PSEU|nr:hypothetical protein [Streptoalloteichus sp. ATCC 53650]